MATNGGTAANESATERDGGFTLIELLIVVLVLGALAAVATFSVRGMTDDGSSAVCETNEMTLASAIEVYQHQHTGSEIPGDDAAERMDALVQAGLINSAAPNFVIESNGDLTPIASCA